MRLGTILDRSERRREEMLVRVERLTELPLFALAFIMVPLLLGPWLWDLSTAEQATFASLNTLIWAAFAVDLGVKVLIATDRPHYLRTHWIDVLIVVVPFLRPLRVLRIALYGSRAFAGARRMVNVDFLLVYGLGLKLVARMRGRQAKARSSSGTMMRATYFTVR